MREGFLYFSYFQWRKYRETLIISSERAVTFNTVSNFHDVDGNVGEGALRLGKKVSFIFTDGYRVAGH